MEDIFKQLGDILRPETPKKQKLNKSLIFNNAWNEHKIKIKHNCKSNFSDCLKRHFKISKMINNH